MSNRAAYLEQLGVALDVIDARFAASGILPAERPLLAALEFVEHFVIEVKEGSAAEPGPPGDHKLVLLSDWFKPILREAAAWYRERYGPRMDEQAPDRMLGVTRIFGTLFRLRVPTAVHYPGKPDETIWVQLPERVLDDEDVLDWVEHPPNMSGLTASARFRARETADYVAGKLRFIRTNLNGVHSQPQLDELKAGIVPHLDRAAEQLAASDPDSCKRAHWDLQMACELAFKLLWQQRSGAFKETHDLFQLYDHIPGGAPPLKRDVLKLLPNWQRMTELRYGCSDPVPLDRAFRSYRATLTICAGVVDGLTRMRVGEAKFEIGQVPWHKD